MWHRKWTEKSPINLNRHGEIMQTLQRKVDSVLTVAPPCCPGVRPKFENFGSDCCSCAQRRSVGVYSHLQNTGECLSWFGAACQPVLLKIVKIVNTEMYFQILIDHAKPSGHHLIGNSLIFQPVSDPWCPSRSPENYSYHYILQLIQKVKKPLR